MQIAMSQLKNQSAFRVNPVSISGEECFLVCLHDPSSVVWTDDNLKFRSSVWNADGELISASFPKFFNWDEQPHIHPAPKSIQDLDSIMEKIDGSTLVVSQYKGELIVRTRGTTDASLLDKNGYEIELLKKMYPKAFTFDTETSDHTRIFEWVSPNNRIVIPYEQCDIYLTSIITHHNYQFLSQQMLDRIADGWSVQRPRQYVFSSLRQMMQMVKAFIGIEGVCCYYNNYQSIRKVKGDEYLIRHRTKEKFRAFKSLVDFFFLENMPHKVVLSEMIEKESDHEVSVQCQDDVECIHDAITQATDWMLQIALFVELVKVSAMDQKEAASFIISRYENKAFQGVAFNFLHNKYIPDNMILKLMSMAKAIVTSTP